ncbi:MAG TPA: molybdopterin cofactor-binding domain-containing protein, partial [Candidatus Acidoferrum sp.]|nr:molybdopterin cofactor-binding domain-containing protein [Candidatus Acidoferrum sp.]
MVRIGVEDVGRRGFLKGMLSAGAFVLSVRLMPAGALAAGLPEEMTHGGLKGPLNPNIWLAIDTDGLVYIIAHRSEMGSGSKTAVPRIAADELDADWKKVRIVQATGDEKYGDQDTDGSHSVRGSFDAMREAGATARLMLVRAAAKQWGVPESECSTGLHEVLHKKSGKKLAYGALASAASKIDVPKKEELKLKDRSEWRYIGKGTPSYDLKAMVSGKAGYGIDARMDGMLYANVAHPPVLGSTVKSVDDSATLAIKGVKQTAVLDTYKPPILFQALGGVAVIADNTWAAIEGKKKLKIEWNESEHKSYSSDPYRKELEETS